MNEVKDSYVWLVTGIMGVALISGMIVESKWQKNVEVKADSPIDHATTEMAMARYYRGGGTKPFRRRFSLLSANPRIRIRPNPTTGPVFLSLLDQTHDELSEVQREVSGYEPVSDSAFNSARQDLATALKNLDEANKALHKIAAKRHLPPYPVARATAAQ